MIAVDCISTGLATWRRRWPHLVLISLEVHPVTLQSLGIAHVDGLPLEAAPWMTRQDRWYLVYRRSGETRRRRICDDDADGVGLLVGEPD